MTSDLTMKPTPLTASDLMAIALSGEPIPADRALATYADESNWKTVHPGGRNRVCEWAFIGPMRPGFELAQITIDRLPKGTKIEGAARELYYELARNCGETADWPLDLVARDEESSKRICELLTTLGKALGDPTASEFNAKREADCVPKPDIRGVADDLYDAACVLMRKRYVENDDAWGNLENSAMRYNAERQKGQT